MSSQGTGKILERVLKTVTPSKSGLDAEKKISDEIVARLKAMDGRHIDVLVCGSIARNTHLKGDRDIDIFVMLPPSISEQEFEKEGLRLGKGVFRGHKWEKAYSQHPYIRGVIRGFDIEIIPSYKVERAEQLQSAVDRSPFHNAYLLKNLTTAQRGEVRLLKQFLKGIGAYGAELKVSSVPGYVTELLILRYGNFISAMEAIAKWNDREVIDLEKHMKQEEALKKFDTPLVVVDPVDKNRNVAAALSLNQYSRIIAAARAFLRKPSVNFFFPKKRKVLETGKVKKLVEKEGLIVVGMGYPKKELPDVLWGQIRRLAKKISGPRIEEGRWVGDIERKHFRATEYIADLLKQLRKAERAGIKKALNKKARILGNKEVLEKYKKNAE